MIVVHIGMPKTGTTALQIALAEKFGGAKLDFLYPLTGRRYGRLPAHHELPQFVKAGEFSSGLMTQLCNEVTENSASYKIISSEGFTNLVNARRVSNLLKFAEILANEDNVKVVIVVRELVDFLNSMYLTTARSQYLASARSERNFQNPSDYLRQCHSWIRNFFCGFRQLQEGIDHNLVVKFFDEHFDSIEMMERIANFPANSLRHGVNNSYRGTKLTLKHQVILMYLDEIIARENFSLERQAVIDCIKVRIKLPRDTLQYSVFVPNEIAEIRSIASTEAESHFQDYNKRFPIDQLSEGPPVVKLSPNIIKDEDIEILRSNIPRLS